MTTSSVPSRTASSRTAAGPHADGGVLVSRRDHVLHVTLCRTLALNSVDEEMSWHLNAVWHGVHDDPGIEAIIISGAGAEAFSIGFDHSRPPAVPISPRKCGVDRFLVVAVNGIACREAMQWVREADVVVASSHARFFEPFAEDGVLRESPRVACEIAPTVHRPITAQQALEIGLVDDVVPLNLLQSTAARRARLP